MAEVKYSEISNFAQDQYAVFVGASSFSTLALTSFGNALTTSIGQVLSLGIKQFAVRFAVRFDSAQLKSNVAGKNLVVEKNLDVETDFDAKFVVGEKDVVLEASEHDKIELKFSLGVLNNRTFADVITEFTIVINNLNFTVDVTAESLVCIPGDSQIHPTFSRASNFTDIIDKYTLDLEDVARVEGMLLYSGLASTISKSISSIHQIDLRRLFPGILFKGGITFTTSKDGCFLFLKGKIGTERQPNSICDCADPADGIGSVEPGKLLYDVDKKVDPDQPVGKITIGGPQPVKINNVNLGNRHSHNRTGDSGLYMPIKKIRELTMGTYPAVRIPLRNDTFIGWKAVAIVDFDFNELKINLKPKLGGFHVELRFRVEVYGSVHVDFGKLGKIRITSFSVEQGTKNKVKIGVYIVIGPNNLFLKPVLEDVSIGEFEVFLKAATLVGTPFGTWGAVIGFIFDKILGQLIAWEIPNHLDLELRKYMGGLMFPILDASYAAEIEGVTAQGFNNLAALYKGDGKGLLFSVGNKG